VQEVLEGVTSAGQGDTRVGRIQRCRERSKEHDDITASCRRTAEPVDQRPPLDSAHAGHRRTSAPRSSVLSPSPVVESGIAPYDHLAVKP